MSESADNIENTVNPAEDAPTTAPENEAEEVPVQSNIEANAENPTQEEHADENIASNNENNDNVINSDIVNENADGAIVNNDAENTANTNDEEPKENEAVAVNDSPSVDQEAQQSEINSEANPQEASEESQQGWQRTYLEPETINESYQDDNSQDESPADDKALNLLMKKSLMLAKSDKYMSGSADAFSSEGGAHDQSSPTKEILDFEQPTQEEINELEQVIVDDNGLIEATNPLIERVQKTLSNILKKRFYQTDLELIAKEEEYRRTVDQREKIGVDLYHIQQELARIQGQIEASQQRFMTIQQERLLSDTQYENLNDIYRAEHDKWIKNNKDLDKHKLDLEKLTKHLKQVSRYEQDLKSEIIIAKQTTLKAEKDLLRKELEKKQQDYFVDRLSEHLRELQDRELLYKTQLLTQKKETSIALETLQDASTEMDAILFEKKQLVHQWKSSLIGLQRRDEMIQQIDRDIQRENDTILSLTMEMNGFKQLLRKQQDQQESLTSLLGKLEDEIEHSKKSIQQINENKEKLKESYALYSKSLSQSQNELNAVNSEKTSVLLEVNTVQKNNAKILNEIQNLEKEIMEQLQNQTSLLKGAESTKKDGGKLRAAVHEKVIENEPASFHIKESNIAQINNEIALVKAEILSIQSNIDSSKYQLKELEDKLKVKNGIIENYELELRRRNDELSKKQAEVDLLNKRYDNLTSHSQSSESTGPLEAVIHQLSKQKADYEKQCIDLESYWLKVQNELVQMSRDSDKLHGEIQSLKMKISILQRKKMYLTTQYEEEDKEFKEFQKKIRHLQIDMVKVNSLLTKHADVQAQLEENNLGLEIKFRSKLRDSELESIRLENQLFQLKEEKEKLIEQIVESERQIMLWEKKIQVAKETQEALDPNVGASEIREMTKEIHRMKLRLTQIQKLQEKLVSEMELCLGRHEAISMRQKTIIKSSTIFNLKKVVQEMNKKLKSTITDIKDADKHLNVLRDNHSKLESFVQQTRQACTNLQEKNNNLEGTMNKLIEHKCKNFNDIFKYQKQLKRFEEVKQGKYVYVCKGGDKWDAEFGKQIEKSKKICTILDLLDQQKKELGSFTDTLRHQLVSYIKE